MKHILVLLPNDTLGGAELYLKNIAIFFLKNGYKVDVVFLKQKSSNGWSDLENKQHINLTYLKARSEKKGFFLFLFNLSNLKNYEYVFTSHVHLTSLFGFLAKLKLVSSTYFVARESTSIFLRFKGLKLILFKILYRLGYSKVDLLICQTSLMKQQLDISLPKLFKKLKIVVLPNPISLPSEVLINEKYVLKKDLNFIVSAGRLIPEKGFDILIKSFSEINKIYEDLHLIILGDGPCEKELRALTIDLNVESKVFFTGFVNNVYKYFKSAKACIVSSRIEGFPNVLLQMMSVNTNVISTSCAGDIDKIKGLYISKVNDVDDLKHNILNCLNSNNSKNKRIFSQELEKRSIENFVGLINSYLVER